MSSQLPDDKGDWLLQTQQLQVKDTSIHSCSEVRSASEIGHQQFLLLRIIYPRCGKPEQLYRSRRELWIKDNSYFDQAKLFFASGAMKLAWESYLDSVSMTPSSLRDKGYDGLHTFALVRYHQIQSQAMESGEVDALAKLAFTPVSKRTRAQVAANYILATPTPAPRLSIEDPVGALHLDDTPHTPSSASGGDSLLSPRDETFSPLHEEIAKQFKAIQDEQIVNTALILYLNSLTIHCTELKADWTLHRLPLISRNSAGEKTYEARVDGYLKRRRDGAPLVILEVKPHARGSKESQVRMQEGAQMAAWINHYPPRNMDDIRAGKAKGRRLLISQDRHEIFLTLAKFDAGYVDYIRHSWNADSKELSYLTMNEYGPFNVGDPNAMRMLGELVLSYSLEVSVTL